MFGGQALMVDGRIVVSVAREGTLLVRADPRDAPRLLAMSGARQAEMGAGRPMKTGWITVAAEALESQHALLFWVDAALRFHRAAKRGDRIDSTEQAARGTQ
jgi:TfoX/Sxy family transcriptional regulator of competence genes